MSGWATIPRKPSSASKASIRLLRVRVELTARPRSRVDAQKHDSTAFQLDVALCRAHHRSQSGILCVCLEFQLGHSDDSLSVAVNGRARAPPPPPAPSAGGGGGGRG